MSDKNNEDLNPEGEVTVYCNHGDGVPVPAFVLALGALLIAGALALGYLPKSDTNACKVSNESTTAQSNSVKAQAESTTASTKRIQAVQIGVADDCVKIHGVPSFQSGNVLCTVMPDSKK